MAHSPPNAPPCRVVFHKARTREEALDNIKDAITGYLASLKKHGEAIPPSTTEEVIEISV